MVGCLTPTAQHSAIRASCDRLSSVESYYMVDIRGSLWEKPPMWIYPNSQVNVPDSVNYHAIDQHRFRSDRVYGTLHPFPKAQVINIIKRDKKDKTPPCDCLPEDFAVVIMLNQQKDYAGLIVLDDHGHFRIELPDAKEIHRYPSPKSLMLPENRGKQLR